MYITTVSLSILHLVVPPHVLNFLVCPLCAFTLKHVVCLRIAVEFSGYRCSCGYRCPSFFRFANRHYLLCVCPWPVSPCWANWWHVPAGSLRWWNNVGKPRDQRYLIVILRVSGGFLLTVFLGLFAIHIRLRALLLIFRFLRILREGRAVHVKETGYSVVCFWCCLHLVYQVVPSVSGASTMAHLACQAVLLWRA